MGLGLDLGGFNRGINQGVNLGLNIRNQRLREKSADQTYDIRAEQQQRERERYKIEQSLSNLKMQSLLDENTRQEAAKGYQLANALKHQREMILERDGSVPPALDEQLNKVTAHTLGLVYGSVLNADGVPRQVRGVIATPDGYAIAASQPTPDGQAQDTFLDEKGTWGQGKPKLFSKDEIGMAWAQGEAGLKILEDSQDLFLPKDVLLERQKAQAREAAKRETYKQFPGLATRRGGGPPAKVQTAAYVGDLLKSSGLDNATPLDAFIIAQGGDAGQAKLNELIAAKQEQAQASGEPSQVDKPGFFSSLWSAITGGGEQQQPTAPAGPAVTPTEPAGLGGGAPSDTAAPQDQGAGLGLGSADAGFSIAQNSPAAPSIVAGERPAVIPQEPVDQTATAPGRAKGSAPGDVVTPEMISSMRPKGVTRVNWDKALEILAKNPTPARKRQFEQRANLPAGTADKILKAFGKT